MASCVLHLSLLHTPSSDLPCDSQTRHNINLSSFNSNHRQPDLSTNLRPLHLPPTPDFGSVLAPLTIHLLQARAWPDLWRGHPWCPYPFRLNAFKRVCLLLQDLVHKRISVFITAGPSTKLFASVGLDCVPNLKFLRY
jgi:hypothetical protein